MVLPSQCSVERPFRDSARYFQGPVIRIPVLCLAFLVAISCRDQDKVNPDSARADSFRVLADSIALDMARAIASTGSRSGQWADAGDSSEWTARMQGEHVAIVEERVRFRDSSTAIRGFFFGASGALEQISEQRREQAPNGQDNVQLIETQIEFTEAGTRGRRTVDGTTQEVPQEYIEQLRRHAAELVRLAQQAPSTPRVP